MKILKEKIVIRNAEPDEPSLIFRFLKDAALWLRGKKIDYWQMWVDPQENFKRWIREGFEAGQFRIVEYEGEIIGIFKLAWDDEIFWGKQEPDSGYIHSFTTIRKYAGLGLGYAVLEKIEELCLEAGKKYLRLDCGKQVTGLREYYERFGFLCVGEVSVFGEELVLYEKKL
jgi:GNAT superfamily N-acetyltransferase